MPKHFYKNNSIELVVGLKKVKNRKAF